MVKHWLNLVLNIPKLMVLDADLAAATKTSIFKKKYPNRFLDCGIAECNMMGVAAGLATCWRDSFCNFFCNVRRWTCI